MIKLVKIVTNTVTGDFTDATYTTTIVDTDSGDQEDWVFDIGAPSPTADADLLAAIVAQYPTLVTTQY